MDPIHPLAVLSRSTSMAIGPLGVSARPLQWPRMSLWADAVPANAIHEVAITAHLSQVRFIGFSLPHGIVRIAALAAGLSELGHGLILARRGDSLLCGFYGCPDLPM